MDSTTGSITSSGPPALSLPRIGFWLADKKWNRINREQLEQLLLQQGYLLIRLDLDEPLETQGPFAAIVHKVSEEMARAENGDTESKRRIQTFENYLSLHSEIILFDNLYGVRLLMDRLSEYKLVADSEVAKKGVVYCPSFVDLTSVDVSENVLKLKEAGVTFPLLCKPLMAHGSVNAHKMSLVFCESGLSEIRAPCVAQSFLNHNARLFKLFVIGNKHYVVKRPSLKNFQAAERSTVHFDAHSISKPDSSSSLIELDEESEETEVMTPSQDIVDAIVCEFRQRLNLKLFGIDVIIEKESGRHAIIDVNVFPGYEGVASFLSDLTSLILGEIGLKSGTDFPCVSSELSDNVSDLHAAASLTTKSVEVMKTKNHPETANNDIDSGIDTSDSCDEKKGVLKVEVDGGSSGQHQQRVRMKLIAKNVV